MNYQQLGERVKQKYPEYKDVDSVVLGQKTASKYPEYKAMITEEIVEKTPLSENKKVINQPVKLGMVEKAVSPFMEKMLPGWNQARQEFENEAPGMIGRQRLVGQIGQSVLLGGAASQTAGKLIPGLAGASLAPRVGRTAIASGVGAQSFDYKGPQERLLATAGSAVAGPIIGEAIGLGVRGLSQVPKAVSKVKESFKAGKKLKEVANNMAKIDTELDELKRIARPDAEANLTSAAVKKAEENKVILDKMGDNLTSTYGKIQDAIESKISAKATEEDVLQIINESLKELDTPSLQGTSVYKTLNGLASKYSPEEGVIQLNPKQFTLNDLKLFKNSVLGKFTPGRSEENLAKAIFRSKYGKFLEQYAPEMLELNTEFSGHINSFKQASRLFQVADEKLLARGAKALEAIAKSNPKNPAYLDNMNILKSLEKSSGRFKGVGKGTLTGNFSSQIDRIKSIDNNIQSLVKKRYLLQEETVRLRELRALKNQILLRIGTALGVGGATAIGIKVATD